MNNFLAKFSCEPMAGPAPLWPPSDPACRHCLRRQVAARWTVLHEPHIWCQKDRQWRDPVLENIFHEANLSMAHGDYMDLEIVYNADLKYIFQAWRRRYLNTILLAYCTFSKGCSAGPVVKSLSSRCGKPSSILTRNSNFLWVFTYSTSRVKHTASRYFFANTRMGPRN